MKSFEVPVHYRSPLITRIKQERKQADKLKKDFTPSVLQFGNLTVKIARHFGFCYGVENAIEIAFKAVKENPDKRIFLLSEIIHNPNVNQDLIDLGVQFLMDTKGNKIYDWSQLTADDVVIIPAFGTTLDLEEELRNIGISPTTYETTCPFVEKVWNRAEKIGKDGFTVVVHGKPKHEETRATFSHSQAQTPTVVVSDMAQTQLLAQYITAEKAAAQFYEDFKGQYSEGFDPIRDLKAIGVVNQTTMLATETQAIADYLRKVMENTFGNEQIKEHFADNRDTLCYATNDNQSAVKAMLQDAADFALVIGGYNSSNTSHLVELCEDVLPTYFIKNAACITAEGIHHYDWRKHEELFTASYLPHNKTDITVMITAGASCPDALVENVIKKMVSLTNNTFNGDAQLLNSVSSQN